MDFESVCEHFEGIDRQMFESFSQENLLECREKYMTAFEQYASGPALDSFILEKLALSMMCNYIFAQESEEALDIWNHDEDDTGSPHALLATGAKMIESAPCISVDDLMVYFQISAYLHCSNRSTSSVDEKQENLEFYMEKCYGYFSESDPNKLASLL
jgi:hypothetical protein